MDTNIVLAKGLSWEALPVAKARVVIDQADLLDQLSQLRAEWEEATDGEMESATVNLRFLFNDLAAMISQVKP